MPRLTDIDRFKKDLAGLARESEVLERWGEVREDPPPPEGGDVAPPKPAKAKVLPKPKPRPAPQADDGLPPDFATLLADLPLDADAALAEAGAPPQQGTDNDITDLDLDSLAPPSSGDLDLDSLLGPGLEPPPESGASEDTGGLVDASPRAETLPGLGEGGAGGFEGPGLLDDLEELEEEPAEGSAPASQTEDFSGAEALQGLADFDFSAEDLGEAPGANPEEASEGGPAEAPAEEAEILEDLEASGDFAMPDLADFGTEPVEGTGSGEALPVETEEAGAGQEGSGDAFSIPDLESFASPGPEEGGSPGPETEAGSSLDSFSIDDFAIPEESPAGSAKAGDAFDGFSLDEGGAGGFDSGFGAETSFGSELPGGGDFGSVDLDGQLAALGDEVSPAATFNLDKDWGAGFEVPGAPEERPSSKAPPRQRPESVKAETVREVSLTEAQVDKLQDRLLSFPLNLRLAVEDSLANEKGTPAQRSRLIWALVERKPFDDVATLVSKILKRRVSIPTGYEKSTGADFQAEQGSFRYLLAHTIMPIAKTALLVLIGVAILGFLGWKFVYTPLAADSLYRSGYNRIAQGRYAEAEKSFGDATKIKEIVPWYYRYAEAYAERRQYLLAEKKYSDLVHRHPGEHEGVLAWARLERDQLKYAEGVRILDDWILVGPSRDPETGKVPETKIDYLNKDALLLQGDIFLDWADEVPAHFEDARRSYATLIQNYGMEDLWLERMLLYFMRTDKLTEVLTLKTHFLAGEKLFPSASTLAELGGYLFDKGLLEDVHTLLIAAQAKDKVLPEAHYHLARYFLKSNIPDEERKALGNAIKSFGLLPVLSPRQEAMFIDSWIRRANAELKTRQYIAAETDYAAAVAEYAKALDLGRVKAAPRFAAAYAGMGNVAYWQRDDLASALAWFEKADAEGFDSPELRYQRGYILYRQGRIPEAVSQFYISGAKGHESPYLLYAFGNALYARKDWSAAEAYWRRTVAAMEAELEQIDLPVPSEKASHAEVAELLMDARNNLGAALLKTSTRTGDARKRAEAVQAFTESTRLFDNLQGELVPMRRAVPGADGKPRNLGLENLNLLLEARRGAEPLLYVDLERGLDFPMR